MIRHDLTQRLQHAIDALVSEGRLPSGLPRAEIADPRDPAHGDFATNFALVASKPAGKNPRELAEMVREAVTDASVFESIDVAGPGFINFRLTPGYIAGWLTPLLAEGEQLAHAAGRDNPSPKRINVEFVSVNPNGPITIGSGRGAAFGSTLCSVLEAAGNTVHREYYINDGVNSEQMRLFAESVKALVEGRPVPDNGYKGDYVQEVASSLTTAGGETVDWFQQQSQALMLKRQHTDLSVFATEFDTWFSEQSLHDRGIVAQDIDELAAKGAADTRPIRNKLKLGKGSVLEDVEIETQAGATEDDGELTPPPSPLPASGEGENATLWLRSTKFGDDQDRVLKRQDGRLTYIASDVAYHKDKFNRPADAEKLITILGPDHHGYIGRLHAVVAALEMAPSNNSDAAPLTELEAKLYDSPADRDACQAALARSKEKLEVVIFQLVRFMKEGKPAPMRKRDGNIYAIIDLVDEIGRTVKPNASKAEQQEVGKDVARFFYLMRSHDTTFDFDLDLAERQSDENPVFYVQYAHARICSVIAKAAEAGLTAESNPSLIDHPKELALIKMIADLPYEVSRAAEDYGVHRLATYAIDLARAYHHFYDACRVIQPEHPELSRARISLCVATRNALRSVFSLLGISAPERMDRETN
ncbi:MAG: arginine--tRNA ligase [Methanoregulaceae archaeon]|nr:arginine--tRNA ligase [Methanoregulaceae archaeon]